MASEGSSRYLTWLNNWIQWGKLLCEQFLNSSAYPLTSTWFILLGIPQWWWTEVLSVNIASVPQRLALPASNVAVGSVINLDFPTLYVLYGNKELILIGQFFSRSSDQALSGVLCLWQQNTVLVYLQQKCSVPRGVRIVDWRLGTEDSLLPSK